jgi:electron transfer flavoprotein beta subunit
MFNSIVMVKQVPDTTNISGKVMRDDGTVNRSKLPAIFNYEDRVALELALQVKEKYGGKVSAVTMGPPRASDVLRECLYMGADETYLISDRKFAGADTLATSFVLSEAIRKIGSYDLIFGGRQAIDGDTAQVGPQTAEKLGIPQITYTEEIIEAGKNHIRIKRKIDGGYEIVESKLPVLITVLKDIVEPRPFSAKRVMAYKNAKSVMDLEKLAEENPLLYTDKLVHEFKEKNLLINTFTIDDLKLDPERCGVNGSPTKVHKIESVVLSGGNIKKIEPTRAGLGNLIEELMTDHIFG